MKPIKMKKVIGGIRYDTETVSRYDHNWHD